MIPEEDVFLEWIVSYPYSLSEPSRIKIRSDVRSVERTCNDCGWPLDRTHRINLCEVCEELAGLGMVKRRVEVNPLVKPVDDAWNGIKTFVYWVVNSGTFFIVLGIIILVLSAFV